MNEEGIRLVHFIGTVLHNSKMSFLYFIVFEISVCLMHSIERELQRTEL